MLIVTPDFERRIDLPGAGPCRRPVDIDRSKVALTRLVSLRVYSFARGAAIDGEAEGDEVFMVLMRGAANVAVHHAGAEAGNFTLREGGGHRVIYMPPHAAYRLTAMEDCDIAYARCEPVGDVTRPRGFAPMGGRLEVDGHATGMALVLELATIAPAGIRESALYDARLPERLIHVRSRGGGAALLKGRRIADWGSAILADGEAATVAVEGGEVDILTITAVP